MDNLVSLLCAENFHEQLGFVGFEREETTERCEALSEKLESLLKRQALISQLRDNILKQRETGKLTLKDFRILAEHRGYLSGLANALIEVTEELVIAEAHDNVAASRVSRAYANLPK